VAVGPAAARAACDAPDDVRVVVDRGPIGGEVAVRCADGGADRPVAEVMATAGVEITWVQRYPGAFVCRLDGQPQDLPCADTPPGDRFWGLFWAAPGDRSWTYATEGAGSLRVPGGGAVGWRLQDGGTREEPAHALSPSAAVAGADRQDAGGAAAGEGGDDAGTTDMATTGSGLLLIAALGVGALVVVGRRR
jgi:hypothetical protein